MRTHSYVEDGADRDKADSLRLLFRSPAIFSKTPGSCCDGHADVYALQHWLKSRIVRLCRRMGIDRYPKFAITKWMIRVKMCIPDPYAGKTNG